MAEKPEQIDRLFSVSDIKICRIWRIWLPAAEILWRSSKSITTVISFVHLKDLDENGFAPLGTWARRCRGFCGS